MSELPEGWIIASLEDISLKVTDGTHKTPNYLESGVRFISIKNIRPYKPIDWNVYERYIAKEEHAELIKRCHPEKGDIVFPRIGTLGFAKIVDWDDEFSIFVGLGLVKPNRNIVQSKYLEHYMNSPFVAEYSRSKATGTGRMTLALGDSKKLPVFLAPLAEQTRIAAKLDELLAQVDTFKTRIDGIPALLKRFRQSVLAVAVSGRLTEEWRRARCKTTENQPFAYPKRKLGVLARFIDYRGKTPEKVDSGIPLITAKNIRQGYISREPQEFIRPEAYEGWMTRGIPQVGDVVITTEAPLGNIATIDIEKKFALAQRAICLQFYEGFSSGFAAIALQSPLLQEELARRSTGTTVKGIKASVLKEIALPNPAIEEQTEIVRRVEQLLAFADQLEALVKAAQSRIDRLTQSILAKAFRGELVPQDPDDEPASVLLERIKTQRAAAPKAKRGRRAATLS
ncbi:MAG: restriction endonuclease subunit S [Pseudomonas sp.]|nr:restriction endonuclease subunit S [Pseudomonas sp.]